jgi:hypothetical protein
MGVADEMDLGKTIQAISFMMCLGHEKLSSKPFFGHCTQEHPSWLGTGRFIAYSLSLSVLVFYVSTQTQIPALFIV